VVHIVDDDASFPGRRKAAHDLALLWHCAH
jgi:hypothetical protein